MFQHHFLHRRPHRHVFFHRAPLLQAAVVSRPGLPAPADTSVPHSNCLAPTSLPGSGRRCLRASASFPPASRLDFVQGTFEKIQLQHLLRQGPLQPLYFLGQHCFPLSLGLRLSLRVQPLSPSVQPPPIHSQLLGQRPRILPLLHPLHRNSPELQPSVLRSSYIRHSQLLSC